MSAASQGYDKCPWTLNFNFDRLRFDYSHAYVCLQMFQTISKPVEDPSELPKWNYDGSSTGQAPGEDSEVIL